MYTLAVGPQLGEEMAGARASRLKVMTRRSPHRADALRLDPVKTLRAE
jgi:hypothetical protein